MKALLARTNAANDPTNANEQVHVPSMGTKPIVENEQVQSYVVIEEHNKQVFLQYKNKLNNHL